ncbi:MAG: lactonase family protein [Planctomycetes bacterium]|nr:lactonase family protein [Planctomycetota bacterium]
MATFPFTVPDSPTRAAEPVVFISSFAAGEEGAIHAFQLDPASGALRLLHRTTGIEHPFFLAISPNQKSLFAIHASTFGGSEPEQVAAFAIEERTGKLEPKNRRSTRGSASCYLEVDATGKVLLVANYSTGSVASLPILEDGTLGEAASFHQHAGSSVNPDRQKGPYAHSIIVSPDNRFVFAADLGLDQILAYRLDGASAKLEPHSPPFAKTSPGAGPRHLAFHPGGRHAYAINELENSVTLFDYAVETGVWTARRTISTLPARFEGTSHCADLKITPNGEFLYGTNRGHDSIAAFSIADDGQLTLVTIEPSLGSGPQNLAIAADGAFLLCANMPGNNVAVFRIDGMTGHLAPVGEPISLARPACIRVLP